MTIKFANERKERTVSWSGQSGLSGRCFHMLRWEYEKMPHQ